MKAGEPEEESEEEAAIIPEGWRPEAVEEIADELRVAFVDEDDVVGVALMIDEEVGLEDED